jgi:hypothetical protein
MANALKLTLLLLIAFFLMSNAKGSKPPTVEDMIHDDDLTGGASYNFISQDRNGANREEG